VKEKTDERFDLGASHFRQTSILCRIDVDADVIVNHLTTSLQESRNVEGEAESDRPDGDEEAPKVVVDRSRILQAENESEF
jgi:hypothetical protein